VGKEPLKLVTNPDATGQFLGVATVGMGVSGQKVQAGEEIGFRIVNGYLTEGNKPPLTKGGEGGVGEVAKDFAASLNLAGGTDGYPLTIRRGELVDSAFILTLQAQDYGVEFTAGPRKVAIDLPVRVRGLVDNGCAAFYAEQIGHFIFIPFVDGDSLFQVALDQGVDVWAGNLFVCDPPDMKLTLVGADEGKPQLEVHNPTDRPMTVKISSPGHTPFFGGYSQGAAVPAGDSVFLAVEKRENG
jgi:hypothetical protein